ncbi:hypothetical protein B2J93_2933 [Marssonina coronariae]|uniref:TauD/TfdA-like domain-containing protein n=1 Tax=Diplocarpon coronariae TaxID=2795749 RepID=A0A218Z328_9HELO|nr:hypothetical protein B2J93_2933 [Marssonina coronariae]
MAPVLGVRYEESTAIPFKATTSLASYIPGRSIVPKHDATYEYEDLKPSFSNKKWPAYAEVPYDDKAHRGSPAFTNLLATATDIFDYNPKVGTKSTASTSQHSPDAAKNELALLIATSGRCYRSFLWHLDAPYELQPSSYTSLKVLKVPPRGGGGDTLWSSQHAAYDALSTPMQNYLESLTALPSSHMQAEGTLAAGRTVGRDPIVTEHPLIRSHPVTVWKALFCNPGFVTQIVGVPKVESDVIMGYLNEVVATTQELHVRLQWGKDDVAFWDNWVTNHSASYSFAPYRRRAGRVAVQAERPFLAPDARSQEQELAREYGLPAVNKDGSKQSHCKD